MTGITLTLTTMPSSFARPDGQEWPSPHGKRVQSGLLRGLMTPFAGWENFYVIVGSSAGALIGLQFVVITLLSGRPAGPGQQEAGAAFGTPTIVHFTMV